VPAKEPLLRISRLSKEYVTQEGDTVHALQTVTTALDDGEFVSVVGPSGCGKTTLMKILGGIIGPTSGELRYNGHIIHGPQEGMGVVFQSPVLLPWLNVLGNVMLPVKVLGLERGRFEEQARSLLELVGLGGFEGKYPPELSGGMQQRVAIVRGLVHDPGVLLMDEPFGALDALTRERMNLELQRIWLASRKTVFFVTHSIPEAVLLSDRILVMSPRPGKIVREFRIPFARPRDFDLASTAEYGQFTQEIRHLLA
jgi:NitT/TauT family transport system ATP-binding protein